MNNNIDTELMRITVEELTLKKQLPLRQQTDKPVLRYDTSMTKPVQLFNQNDTIVRRDSRSQQITSSGAQPSGQNSSPHRGSVFKARNTGNSSGSNLSSPAKGVNNPYSRPLSAKEVSQDVQQHHRLRWIQHQAGQSPLSSFTPPAAYNQEYDSHIGGSVLQQNSFLRPQSGVIHDSTLTKQSLWQKKEQRGVIGSSDVDSIQGIDGKTQAMEGIPTHKEVTKVSMPSEQSAKVTLQQAFTLASTTSAVASHPALSGLSVHPKSIKNGESNFSKTSGLSGGQMTVVRNPNYSPNKPYNDISSSTYPSGDGQHINNLAANLKQTFSSTIQSSAKSSGSKAVSGPSQPSIICPPTAISSATSQNRQEMSALNHGIGRKNVEQLNETALQLQNLTANSLLNTRMGMLRKMPVTNTLTGTLYYKKSFREATKLVEQRQKNASLLEHRARGDGAPSKLAHLTSDEKGLHIAGAEDAEEEDNDTVSTPSGERLPGDGEASVEELDDDDDDDGIEDIYEDDDDVDDGDSDDYTIGSTISQASSSTVRLRSVSSCPSTTQSLSTRAAGAGEERTRSFVRPVTSSGDTVTQPAFRPSLFPAIPPTINFISEGQKVEQLPWEIRKFLKWRMSPITPNIVKSALGRINFRITKKNHDWLGCFGKHMKANAFKSLREYQKLNHFPGSFQLGRKDRLWRNLSKLQVSFGKKEYGFFPQTYVLPNDLKQLKRAWEDSSSRQKWIIKPPASARGIGIKVISKWNQIPRKRPVIVQKYLAKPLLINDSKFDMRIYVYVTSYDPLRAYVFEDGLARFASCKYSTSMKNLNNKFMHLTNYSINKRNAEYQSNTDDSVCQGHKWSLKSLWSYLKKQGVNTQAVWDNIKDIVVKSLISVDGPVNSMVKSNVRSRYVVHELFGFDILLDDQLRPWILEVNISPSLHSNSQLDINIKGQMIRDMMNLAGFRVPDKNDVHSNHSSFSSTDLSAHIPSTDYCMDKRLFTSQLSPDERAKHAYFCHKHQDEQLLQNILDTLTPDDVRILTESIDEDSRKGGFIRVFPTPSTKKYLRFFEQPRYYNLLLDQWVTRYNRMEQRGISLLQSLCEEGLHLENPTDDVRHQWCPPSSAAILSARDKTTSPLKREAAPGQAKLSSPISRLPKVRSGTGSGVSQPPSSLSHATGTSSFSAASSSPTASRVARPREASR